ncbi:MAG: hypothetical protein QNK37_04265 [Acidobacteriota bacterium]|nr:hypothetical protein [Acidobacteriota bacterium]
MFQTKADGIRMADSAMHSYQLQADDLLAERRQLHHKHDQAKVELKRSLEHLAAGLVSEPDPEEVKRAAQETGALHLPERLRLLHRQHKEYTERMAEIDASEDYLQRDNLIHPKTGQLTNEVHEAENLYNGLRHQKERYEFDQFIWLYDRDYHLSAAQTGFKKFWRVMTLADFREKRAMEAVRDRLEKDDFSELVRDYESLVEKCDFLSGELIKARKRYQAVIDLVEERNSLGGWLDGYQDVSLEALRSDLAEFLKDADFEAIHHTVRKAGRILVARCQALAKKVQYYLDMVGWLDNEIRDRCDRIESINRVRKKWSVKPYGMLRGDKTKWLVTLPDMKAAGTAKRVRWVRTMGSNIHNYNEYHHYNAFMTAGLSFVAYDAFARAADERMPYEGFSRTVIDELDQYRIAHNMEAPDYPAMNEVLEEHDAELTIWEDWDGSFNEAAALEATLEAAAAESQETEQSLADES